MVKCCQQRRTSFSSNSFYTGCKMLSSYVIQFSLTPCHPMLFNSVLLHVSQCYSTLSHQHSQTKIPNNKLQIFDPLGTGTQIGKTKLAFSKFSTFQMFAKISNPTGMEVQKPFLTQSTLTLTLLFISHPISSIIC